MPLNVVVIFFEIVVLILAFSVHECAHAWTANRLGDPTAMMLGRVTLNPLKHLDLLGSVLVPLISLVYGGYLIGWAFQGQVSDVAIHAEAAIALRARAGASHVLFPRGLVKEVWLQFARTCPSKIF